jgi:HK97 gp10 family phage protein
MVEGVERLKQRLGKAFTDRIKAAARAALEESAIEVVATMKRFAPVAAVDGGTLRDSIGWTWGKPPKGSFKVGEVRADPNGTAISIYAGNKDAFYARWQEFGTSKAPPHPFFYPSWRLHRKKVKGRLTRAVNKAIREMV